MTTGRPETTALPNSPAMLTSPGRLGQDRPPPGAQPSRRHSRLALATVTAIAGSLGANAVLVAVGQAVFPGTRGYAHFQFPDYCQADGHRGHHRVRGLAGRHADLRPPRDGSSSRLAILVTLALWLPDAYILYLGQPADAVAVLVVMHLAIALITYNLLVRLAPRGSPPGASAHGEPRALSAADFR